MLHNAASNFPLGLSVGLVTVDGSTYTIFMIFFTIIIKKKWISCAWNCKFSGRIKLWCCFLQHQTDDNHNIQKFEILPSSMSFAVLSLNRKPITDFYVYPDFVFRNELSSNQTWTQDPIGNGVDEF